MNILKTIRSHEWWGYKLSPLLAIGYATAMGSGRSILYAAPRLLYIMSALIIGAAYVSVINDVTDLEEDLASGKRNRMANIPSSRRWIFPAVALLAGAGYISTLYPHVLLMALATMPWLAFSCYSIPPVRLKKRGFAGVLADASGAHLFTSLFIVAGMSYYTAQPLDWILFAAVGCWALCYGLRGILWHQFMDRDNDLLVGLRTFATQVDPVSFRWPARLIMGAEGIALCIMLWRIGKPLPFIFLTLYFLFTLACRRKLGIRFIMIQLPPGQQPYHIFMGDYYQVFFPVSLLLSSALTWPYDLIVLGVHMLLFYDNVSKLGRYGIRVLGTMLKSKQAI